MTSDPAPATVRDFIASSSGEPGIGDGAEPYRSDYEATTASRFGRTPILVVTGVVLATLALPGVLLL